MAARTSDTLKEIDQIRARLDVRFAELERRLPPLARRGRAMVRMLGGGVGAGVALFVARRVAARTGRVRRKDASVPQAPAVVIKSGVGAPAALAVAAVWAGVRLYENRVRDDRAAGAVPGASIVPLPGRRRA